MRILADENLPRLAVEALRAAGHSVDWIAGPRTVILFHDSSTTRAENWRLVMNSQEKAPFEIRRPRQRLGDFVRVVASLCFR